MATTTTFSSETAKKTQYQLLSAMDLTRALALVIEDDGDHYLAYRDHHTDEPKLIAVFGPNVVTVSTQCDSRKFRHAYPHEKVTIEISGD